MANGHDQLLHDLRGLLEDAENNYFHDFKSDFGNPKIMLVSRLTAITERVKQGVYDN